MFSVFPISDRQCNPSLLSLVHPASTTPPPGFPPTPAPANVQWWDAQGIVGLLIFLFCTLYARYCMVYLNKKIVNIIRNNFSNSFEFDQIFVSNFRSTIV